MLSSERASLTMRKFYLFFYNKSEEKSLQVLFHIVQMFSWVKKGCDEGTLTVATGFGTHKQDKVWVDIRVPATGLHICLHNMCGQQRNSPMADPIFGSKYGPQNGAQNWITFSIAENKTEQKSAEKRRQRLLKAPLKPRSYDARVATAGSVSS